MLTGENDSNTLRMDAHIFENGEKIYVFKNIRKRVAGALVFKLWIMLIITTPACNKMSRPFASYKNKKLFYEPK